MSARARGEDPQQRRLARTVRSEQAVDRPPSSRSHAERARRPRRTTSSARGHDDRFHQRPRYSNERRGQRPRPSRTATTLERPAAVRRTDRGGRRRGDARPTDGHPPTDRAAAASIDTNSTAPTRRQRARATAAARRRPASRDRASHGIDTAVSTSAGVTAATSARAGSATTTSAPCQHLVERITPPADRAVVRQRAERRDDKERGRSSASTRGRGETRPTAS